IRGMPDQASGMLMDLGLLQRALDDARDALDHRFLDEINDLGPATMENLSAWIWRRLAPAVPKLARVTVFRDSTGAPLWDRGPGKSPLPLRVTETPAATPPRAGSGPRAPAPSRAPRRLRGQGRRGCAPAGSRSRPRAPRPGAAGAARRPAASPP